MKNKIPSEEDFERVRKIMEYENRHLDAIAKAVIVRFEPICPMYNVYLMVQIDVDFRAYVFFNKDVDVLACKSNGITTLIEDAVYEELEKYGRGKRGEIVVAFEWDSNESVQKHCGGDYLTRLR